MPNVPNPADPSYLYLDASSEIELTVTSPSSLHILAGGISEYGPVSNNTLTIENAVVSYTVYGGITQNGDASGNTVTVVNGTFGTLGTGVGVYGGMTFGGNVYDNSVAITGGNFYGGVFGGAVDALGFTTSGIVTGSGTGSAYNNTVTATGGTFHGLIIKGSQSSGAEAYSNYAEIRNVAWVDGPEQGAAGGTARAGNVRDNHLLVSGNATFDDTSNVRRLLAGALIEGAGGSSSGTYSASGNSVTIDAGTSFGAGVQPIQVTGAHIVDPPAGATATASENWVAINGWSDLSRAQLSGYSVSGTAAGVTGSNNSLFTTNAKDLRVQGISNFSYYEFALPADAKGGDTIYTITGTAPVDLADATISVTGDLGGGNNPANIAGQPIILFNRAAGTNTAILSTGQLNQGLSLTYAVTPYQSAQTNGSYGFTLSDPQINPNTAAFAGTQVAQLMGVGLASDFLAGQGYAAATLSIDDEYAAAASTRGFASLRDNYYAQIGGPSVFAAIGGGARQYLLSGNSAIHMRNASLLLGVANRDEIEEGRITYGGFLEGGYGRWHGEVNDVRVNHNDDFRYIGVGLLARYERRDGYYLDGAIHVGGIKTAFSGTPAFSPGITADYSADSLYYGLNLGGGYRMVRTESLLDLSARFIWDHIEDDRATIAGDPFRFDSIGSHRLRLGGRWEFSPDCFVNPYAGAAYEYEFTSSSSGSVWGYALPETSARGATVLGELGAKIGGRESLCAWDIGMQGFFGKRRGVQGAIRFETSF
jgi:hypothetical protein